MKTNSSVEEDPATNTTSNCDTEINVATIVGIEASPAVYTFDRKQTENAIKKYCRNCQPKKTHVLHILALAVVWILYTIPIIVFYATDADLRVSKP